MAPPGFFIKRLEEGLKQASTFYHLLASDSKNPPPYQTIRLFPRLIYQVFAD
ncbi:Lactate dehydrogenase or related 2-hydroxyacid dehydrogenase [Pseudomonas syringae pv. actinidiae]|uniref:Lactate dehydrogenase or related 2-hydroxyacid dehydrogenase n=1 Tax=Pseudomonas syringae pv. actinidiae TaxID=103796 RepID=A0AAN4Q2E0_PSESF|nr:Lactate dehydrogenase or related 2-hydroxyacid dehydrogenase [Pseudomonas syringae pv. actinidiae]